MRPQACLLAAAIALIAACSNLTGPGPITGGDMDSAGTSGNLGPTMDPVRLGGGQ